MHDSDRSRQSRTGAKRHPELLRQGSESGSAAGLTALLATRYGERRRSPYRVAARAQVKNYESNRLGPSRTQARAPWPRLRKFRGRFPTTRQQAPHWWLRYDYQTASFLSRQRVRGKLSGREGSLRASGLRDRRARHDQGDRVRGPTIG